MSGAAGGGRAGAHRAALALCLAGLGWFAANALLSGPAPRSPLWFAELLPHALLLAALIPPALGRAGPRPPAWRRPGLAFLALSWAFGMTYELSLTVDGSGIGGVHPDTRASFLLAQGDYLPIAAAALWAARRLPADLPALVWVALGMSLTEGLVFTGVLAEVVASPLWPWAPVVLAYYALAYAGFVALPAAFAPQPAAGRRAGRGPPAWPLLVGWGFAAAFAIRLVWGLVYAPLVTAAFGLPPNPL